MTNIHITYVGAGAVGEQKVKSHFTYSRGERVHILEFCENNMSKKDPDRSESERRERGRAGGRW